eukprot:gene5492-7604_t
MNSISVSTQNEIFSNIRKSFLDFELFDTLVAKKLRKAINDTNTTEITMLNSSAKSLLARYFEEDDSIKDDKKLVNMISKIFLSTYVLILSTYEENQHLKWHGVDKLLEEYGSLPEFDVNLPKNECDERELYHLLNFRNMLKIALIIIPAESKKCTLLQIAARLEGSNKGEYITGGGQKPAVTRRVSIYRREGNVKPRVYIQKEDGKKAKKNSTNLELIPPLIHNTSVDCDVSIHHLHEITSNLQSELAYLIYEAGVKTNDGRVQQIQRLLQIAKDLETISLAHNSSTSKRKQSATNLETVNNSIVKRAKTSPRIIEVCPSNNQTKIPSEEDNSLPSSAETLDDLFLYQAQYINNTNSSFFTQSELEVMRDCDKEIHSSEMIRMFSTQSDSWENDNSISPLSLERLTSWTQNNDDHFLYGDDILYDISDITNEN